MIEFVTTKNFHESWKGRMPKDQMNEGKLWLYAHPKLCLTTQ
jgi:hypothetical protein